MTKYTRHLGSSKVRKLTLLVASCAVALFIGSGVPASADNGPHVKLASPDMIADKCAACHRAHTAKAAYLLAQEEEALCFTCHGTSGTGANTNVKDGVGWDGAGRTGSSGALRGGGFTYALIDSDGPTSTPAMGNIPALSTGQASTSNHSVVGTTQTVWGNGPTSSTANSGSSTKLECGSCHDPHGNGNYRILRPVPPSGGATASVTVTDPAGAKVYTTTNYWDVKASTDDTLGPTHAASKYGPAYQEVTGNFIGNIAAWCSTCHTRYLAPTGSYKNSSGDAVYTYRHSSNFKFVKGASTDGPVNPGRPNCIQCHVSHGSNATMGNFSSAVTQPDGSTAATGGSRLLRADNRGTCQMCHRK